MPSKEITEFRQFISSNQKRPEHIVPISLRGDLDAQIVDLDMQLVEIKQDRMDDRLTGNPAAVELGKKHAALREEALKFTANVYLRGLPKAEWADLVKENPSDQAGVDYAPSIWNEAVPRSIYQIKIGETAYEPDRESLDKFLEGVTDGQWDLLAGGAAKVNVGDGATPFSVLASRALPSSGEGSKPPEPSA
jgi:hypothetical protein